MTQLQAAKDLLKRAVELDSAQRYSEARICYEEGIHNLLRCMKGQCGQSTCILSLVWAYCQNARVIGGDKRADIRHNIPEYTSHTR